MAERLLWSVLRNGALGAKCRRQVPFGPFILDFVFFEARLVIEADGVSHDGAGAQARDVRRDAWLEAQGFRVLRFADADVRGNLDGVVAVIRMALADASAPSP